MKTTLKKPPPDDPPLDDTPPPYEDIIQPPIPQLDPSKRAGLPHSSTVTPDQCAAHLKFLGALADLRDSVANHDGLFGINDSSADRFPDFNNDARARIREKRWAVYTTRAVDRYTAWWNSLPDYGTCPTIETLQTREYDQLTECKTQVCLNENSMPPLDVLMVWHSHMLNPRAFLEDCIRYAKMSLWRSSFPWGVINACINDNTMEYSATVKAKELFEGMTGLNWDNLDDSPNTSIECPGCQTFVTVPWTAGQLGNPQNGFESSYGFSDKAFLCPCPTCNMTIDHERLKVAKFRKDLRALLEERRPMPGTFYNLGGVAEAALDIASHAPSFPNRFLWAANKSMMGLSDANLKKCKTVAELRRELEARLKNKDIIREATSGAALQVRDEYRHTSSFAIRSSLLPKEKIPFRRMMSRYWDNISPFALDLVGAVTRQGVFVRKMDDIDWLHSPTVMSTMGRLINKYRIFLKIMIENPRELVVPTLDVDLAWHTHQLSPARYYHYCLFKTGQKGIRYFIDHDDRVEENRLSNGFEWTSKMYRKMTSGGVYSECSCWYCQAVMESDVGSSSIFTTPSRSRARSAVDNLHASASSDPNKNPHISAHNAVRPARGSVDPDINPYRIKFLRQKYEKARRRTEKRDRKLGKDPDSSRRDDAHAHSWPLVWGYPLYMPMYLPFMADPGIHADVYACNPGCMSTADGAPGNCAAGTCGGGVASGSCGGLGAGGSCAGGCAGGVGGMAVCGGGAACAGASGAACAGGGGFGGGFGGCGGGGGGGGGCGGGGGGGC